MTMDPKLPLELGDLILDCLDSNDDQATLRNCALVSRGWARSSQRNLFRDINLPAYEDMIRLRTCLEGSPHLATYTRGIYFGGAYTFLFQELVWMDEYMTCLNALLSLFSHVTSVDIQLAMSTRSDVSRERFLARIRSNAALERFLARLHVFLCASPVVELTLGTYHLDAVFPALDGLLIGSRIRRLTVLEWDADQPPPSTIVSPLPSLEVIRLGRSCSQHRDISDWLDHQPERFPKLRCCEILVTSIFDLFGWCGKNSFESLRSETFRFEFSSDYVDTLGRCALILKGLHFRHILFTIHVPPRPREVLSVNFVRRITEWWTKTLNTLSDSKTSVCFTELTFTAHLLAVSEVMEAWHALDVALCHEAFRGMRSVHLENLNGCRITEGDYPTDAALIQLALPGLAGRGLLSL